MYCTTGIMKGISNVRWVTSHPTTIIVVIAREASDRQGYYVRTALSKLFCQPRVGPTQRNQTGSPF